MFMRSLRRWLHHSSSLFSAYDSLECPRKHLFCPEGSISKTRCLLASVNNAHMSPLSVSHPQIHCVGLSSSWEVGESFNIFELYSNYSRVLTPSDSLGRVKTLPSEYRLDMNPNLEYPHEDWNKPQLLELKFLQLVFSWYSISVYYTEYWCLSWYSWNSQQSRSLRVNAWPSCRAENLCPFWLVGLVGAMWPAQYFQYYLCMCILLLYITWSI